MRTADVESRLELLAGLMDTDGHLQTHGTYDYSSKSRGLVEDVAFLTRSVGLAAYISSKVVGEEVYWRVSVSGRIDMIPCRIPRKRAGPRRQKKSVLRVGIRDIVRVSDNTPFYGFEVDGDHRYLLEDFTVQHNTIILAASMKSLNLPTVYLVHTSDLFDQTRESLQQHFLRVGAVGGGRRDWQRVTVAMVQTLHRLVQQGDTRKFNRYRMIVGDECHHVGTKSKKATWYQVFRHFEYAGVRIGVSATINMENEGLLLQGATGPLLARITVGQLQSEGYLARTSCRFVPFRHNMVSYDLPKNPTYSQLYRACITSSLERNALVVGLVAQQAMRNKLVLVFVDQVNHGRGLWLDLQREWPGLESEFVSGEDRKADIQKVKKLAKARQLDVLIATRKLFGEGTDIPAVDVVVNAAAGKDERTFIQMFGRGLRISPGKSGLEYFDVRDIGPRTIARHAESRISHCRRALGQRVQVAARYTPDLPFA